MNRNMGEWMNKQNQPEPNKLSCCMVCMCVCVYVVTSCNKIKELQSSERTKNSGFSFFVRIFVSLFDSLFVSSVLRGVVLGRFLTRFLVARRAHPAKTASRTVGRTLRSRRRNVSAAAQ